MFNYELTLAILKPHVLSNPIAYNAIKNIIITSNFKIAESKLHKLTLKEAEKFYDDHRGKFFYNRLITFMTSGKSHLCILTKENAIVDWRKLLGPTKVYKTQYSDPNTIRGLYGLSDTRNVAHGSDSTESARREIDILFPNFDIDRWFKHESNYYSSGDVEFNENDFVHVVKNDI